MIRKVGDGIALRPVDLQFIENIRRRVSASSALPQNLQLDAILNTIVDAAEFFYDFYSPATQRKWVGLNTSAANYQKDVYGNKTFILDGSVQGIVEAKEVNGTFGGIINSAYITSGYKSILSALLNIQTQTYNNVDSTTNGVFTGASSVNNSGTQAVYGNGTYKGNYNGGGYSDASDYFIAMHDLTNQTALLKTGVFCSFNRLTQEINILGAERRNIAVEAFIRIPIEKLFGDYMFLKYCVAKCNEHIGRIILTYDFELLGGSKVNGDTLLTYGQTEVEKIEELIRNEWNVAPSSIVI